MTDSLEIIPPNKPLRGRVAPPGSKSITNRALLLAGLAQGTSRLSGALKSDDTRYMAQALRQMGVVIDEPDATSFVVTGTGGLTAPDSPLFLGNAGTATRFLTAAAALADGKVVITGDEHMQKRPIAPLVKALRDLGVDVSAPTGCPPVTVNGHAGFDGSSVTVDAGLSSQYVSALLMLAAGGRNPVKIALEGAEIGAKGYVDLTVAAMRAFGARVTHHTVGMWEVEASGYRCADFAIEPDASAATYLWAAEVLTGGKIDLGTASDVFTQPDARAYEIIAQFPNMPAVIDGSQMQDAVPTLAALAAFNNHPVKFVGIANLRVKECDRVAAMANELSRVVPEMAIEQGDDLIVTPSPISAFKPANIQTYSDHRIAMSMALVALKAPGVTILDPGCVAKTYPNYWLDLGSLGVETVARA